MVDIVEHLEMQLLALCKNDGNSEIYGLTNDQHSRKGLSIF